jgi:glycosyltransferase involved in cell wall biosynthesis
MEAMLVGTPVVAKPNGGIVEYLQPQVNGYWMDDDAPEVSVLGAVGLDRQKVRNSILPAIDVELSTDRYLALLSKAADGGVWPEEEHNVRAD